jgi:hypothetical protein
VIDGIFLVAGIVLCLLLAALFVGACLGLVLRDIDDPNDPPG